MLISNTCKAAIKAVIFLAAKSEQDQKSPIKEIATSVGENEHSVGKLLQTLVKQGIINSSKGPSGGFYLSKTQSNQSLYKIVEAIDGKHIFNKCGLGLHKCSAKHPCPIHNEYETARNHVENLFKTNKVSDMIDSIQKGKTFLSD